MPFSQFHGQNRAVTYLSRQIKGARLLGVPALHMQFIGPSGTGKSTLVRCCAAAYGTKAHILVGGPRLSDLDVARMATQLSPCDFVGVDEAHSVPHAVQERLFQLVDDGIAPGLAPDDGKGGRPRVSGTKQVGPITLILATNRPGLLLDALHSRVGERIVLGLYAESALIGIGRQIASHLHVLITPQALRLLAIQAEGIPRRLRQLIEALRLYGAHGDATSEVGIDHVREYLDARGATSDGLYALDITYLRALAAVARPTLLRTLAAAVGLDSRYVSNHIEDRLLKRGLITLVAEGRMITEAGAALLARTPSDAPPEETTP